MNEARVTRVSSAIDLDLTAVVEETARLVRAEIGQVVAEQTMPVLAQLQAQIQALSGLLTSAALGEADTVATLACHLPAGTIGPDGASATGTGDTLYVARFQAARLLESGYAIVPVGGAALAHTIESATPVPAAPLPVLPTPDQVRDLSAPEAVELTRELNQHRVTSDVSTQRDEVESYVSGLRQP